MDESKLKTPNIDSAPSAPDDDIDEYQCARRRMSFREEFWFYCVRTGFLLVSALLSFAVIVVYMWHLVGPPDYRWLSQDDLIKIKDLVIAIVVGLLMSSITTYFFKRNGNGR